MSRPDQWSTSNANSNHKLDALSSSLRAARVARGGRNARHGPSRERNALSSTLSPHPDIIVQQTDDDAAGSRLSAAELGYFDDPFARAFAKGPEVVRRQPIINRGTFVRMQAVDTLVGNFLQACRESHNPRCQVISLGAGTDTRWFRLMRGGEGRLRVELGSESDPSKQEPALVYHELDFPATTARKIAAIQHAHSTLDVLQQYASDYRISQDATSLTSSSLNIHAIDLRSLVLAPDEAVGTISKQDESQRTEDELISPIPNLELQIPTLLLSEMCLTYLPSSTSTAILSSLFHVLQHATASIVLYEPFHPHDAFGRTMISNLASRGISLPGLEELPTFVAHEERLRSVGCRETKAWTVKDIWDTWISLAGKEKLRGCEMVDEEEEWDLLGRHYGIVWGRRGPVASLQAESSNTS